MVLYKSSCVSILGSESVTLRWILRRTFPFDVRRVDNESGSFDVWGCFVDPEMDVLVLLRAVCEKNSKLHL